MLIAVRPTNPVSWAFALTGLLFALGLLTQQYAAYGLLTRSGSLPGAEGALWTQTWVYQPGLFLMEVIVPLYFPTERL